MLRIALTSLSAVPTRRVDSNKRSATNCSCGGIINLVPRIATIILRSSTNVEMSIRAFSSEVSLRSAAVDGSLRNVPPPDSGCAVEHNSTPSPPVKFASNALLSVAAAFTCFVCAIERAKAFV